MRDLRASLAGLVPLVAARQAAAGEDDAVLEEGARVERATHRAGRGLDTAEAAIAVAATLGPALTRGQALHLTASTPRSPGPAPATSPCRVRRSAAPSSLRSTQAQGPQRRAGAHRLAT